MSGLDKLSGDVKKKMALHDYVNTVIHQEVKAEKPQKRKATIYLTETQWEMFNELCSHEVKMTGKTGKGDIVGNAIEMYYHSRMGKNTK